MMCLMNCIFRLDSRVQEVAESQEERDQGAGRHVHRNLTKGHVLVERGTRRALRLVPQARGRLG